MISTRAGGAGLLLPSRFNLIVAAAGTSDVLVFNTLKGSAALVARSAANALARSLPRGAGTYAIRRGCLTDAESPSRPDDATTLPLNGETAEELLSTGMLVKSEDDEAEMSWRLLQRLWRPRVFKVTLSYTAACQLACTYCFQSGRDMSYRHTPALRESTLAWAENYLDEHPRLDTVHLGLFGGEPLADVATAKAYIDAFRSMAAKRGLAFTMSLTSNGLNLDRDLVAAWAAQGLGYLRVTLDGPPAVHNRRRPWRSGAGSFERIVENLCAVTDVEGFGIGVNVNIDEENAHRVSELLDILESRGLKDHIEIILEPTFPPMERARTLSDRSHDSLDPSRVGEILRLALEQVTAMGFSTPPVPGLCVPCNFIQESSFVVSWTGELFRCSFTMLDESMAVGSVADGVSKTNEKLLAARHVADLCVQRKCAYLPLCGGGCRYWAWCRSGDWAKLDCPIEFWDRVLPLSLTHSLGLQPLPASCVRW